MSTVTKEQVASALKVTQMVAEAIREAGEITSGHLYAMLMSVLDLEQYNKTIALLKRTGLVTESNHVLKWQEPKGGNG